MFTIYSSYFEKKYIKMKNLSIQIKIEFSYKK